MSSPRARFRCVLLPVPDTKLDKDGVSLFRPACPQSFEPTIERARVWASAVLPGAKDGSYVEVYRQEEVLTETIKKEELGS